jgi:hypothetical protein
MLVAKKADYLSSPNQQSVKSVGNLPRTKIKNVSESQTYSFSSLNQLKKIHHRRIKAKSTNDRQEITIIQPKISDSKSSVKLEILTLVGKNCITIFDGQKVYDLIHPKLQANQPVELDFTGVEIFAAPFFNFAFGQLLRDIKPKNIKHLLKVSNINSLGNQILKLVIENSKRYYSDPIFRSRLDKIIREQPRNL